MRRILMLAMMLAATLVSAHAQQAPVVQLPPSSVPLVGGTMTGTLNVPGFTLTGPGITGLIGASTTASAAGSTLTYDYTQNVSDTRWIWFNNTINPSSNTTNIWEQLNDYLTLGGTNSANGEINLFHENFILNSGASAAQVEDAEIQAQISGTLTNWDGLLVIPTINVGSTVSGSLFGLKFQLANAGSGGSYTYAAIDNEAMSGGGTAPNNYYFIRNFDSAGLIFSNGAVNIGSSSSPANTTMLSVQAPGTGSNCTIKVAAGESTTPYQTFCLLDSGTLQINQGSLNLGSSGVWGKLTFGGGGSGTIQLSAPASGSISGNVILPGAATTLAGLGIAETFSALQTFSAYMLLTPVATASLPTCNTGAKGMRGVVSDASSPTYGGTLTGGSSTAASVLCNGTNWITE